MRSGVFECGDWQVDLARRELRARNIPVRSGDRAFEILGVLVSTAGTLVTKDALMTQVWSGAIVEENTLQVHISAVRKALGTDRGMLKTVSGRGYRLSGEWRQRDAADIGRPEQPMEGFLRGSLPYPGPGLIGRAEAKKALKDLLSAYRIVTLTGPGGIGKTRLALAVAHDLAQQYAGDARFVELVSLSDPNLIPTAVAATLGLKIGGEISPASVARAVGGRRLLLVLDNCEHVIDGAALVVETLLSTCPGITILATSREILRVDGERVHRVSPLSVPGRQDGTGNVLEYSSVQLLVARTKALHSAFSPQPDELPMMAAVCRQLDGIPLAIELAAARAATLSLKQVAARLDDRFALLTGGRRAALPRHQTLRAALDWSYELLPEVEKRLLRRLSVFAGGFTLEAAAAVDEQSPGSLSSTVTNLAALLDKSLISQATSTSGGRWQLLETTRAYAAEKLAAFREAESTARCHAEYYRDLAQRALSATTDSASTADHMALLEREMDNVRAALDWAFSPRGDSSIGVVLTAA